MEIKANFKNNEKIPVRFTIDGRNISPGFKITNIPKAAKTIAIIVDDPDSVGKTWTHWLVWNIPANYNVDVQEGGKFLFEGLNDFNEIKYLGPSPPRGHGVHRYFFKFYALDNILDLKRGSTKDELEEAMKYSILQKSEIIGTYSR